MGLVRQFLGVTGLGQTLIRQLGDAGGPVSSRVSSELDNIIAWAKDAPRVLHRNFGSAGSSGAGETDLMTFSVPGGTLGTDNDFLRVCSWGNFANNTNTKTVRVYYAGTDLGATITSTGAAAQSQVWGYEVLIARTGAATAETFITTWLSPNASAGPNTQEFTRIGTPAPTHANANTFKNTGQGTNNNDVTEEGLIIELYQQ